MRNMKGGLGLHAAPPPRLPPCPASSATLPPHRRNHWVSFECPPKMRTSLVGVVVWAADSSGVGEGQQRGRRQAGDGQTRPTGSPATSPKLPLNRLPLITHLRRTRSCSHLQMRQQGRQRCSGLWVRPSCRCFLGRLALCGHPILSPSCPPLLKSYGHPSTLLTEPAVAQNRLGIRPAGPGKTERGTAGEK